MNNKGFMMAEVIVVAAIILVALTGFYSLYTTAISEYDQRLDYYDVTALYELANYRDKQTNFSNEIDYVSDGYVELEGENNGVTNKKIYLLAYNKILELRNKETLNETFDEFLTYIQASQKFKYEDHLLVMEKCKKDNDGNYTMDCKYAYLETAVK